ncbi:hypothetical protein HPB47_022653 [Ixodes persulcatus]|uniref:Uncharacterized protein n=1 Tax=Ixodes persulcatus TaxID=34615 RepID=A0AC60QZJ8_IXOPE|nr:hypothetical protein HPB47_022653 [Ixodes persulcatus]
MHPTFHEGRRRSRASTHHKLFTHRSDVLYVDAAEYGYQPAFAAVVTTSTGQVKTCATVFTASPEQAEEAAIALALTATPCPKVIVSDSKAAILNFAKGYISAPAKIILRAKPLNSFESNVSLIWTPAHAGLCGNELAHSTARGYTVRAGWTQSLDRGARSARERLVGFYDITSHYRLSRRLYPPATQALSREESVMWRQLQTHSFPGPLVLSHIYPSLYNPTCIFCSARATLSHILWECPSFHLSPFPSEERWDAALRSSDPTTQLQVVRRAAEVAEAHGLPATRQEVRVKVHWVSFNIPNDALRKASGEFGIQEVTRENQDLVRDEIEDVEEVATLSPKPLEVPELDERAGDGDGTKASEVAAKASPTTGATENNEKAEQVPATGTPVYAGGIDEEGGNHQCHGNDRQW